MGLGVRMAVALAVLVSAVGAQAAGAAERVYWTNAGNDTISFANLDGSGGGGS